MEKFYLDPEYKIFQPSSKITPLKFNTLSPGGKLKFFSFDTAMILWYTGLTILTGIMCLHITSRLDIIPNLPLFILFYGIFAFFFSGSIFILSVIYKYRKALINYPILQKNGVLLNGEIVKCTSNYEGKYRSQFYIYVTYRFNSPSGKLLTGKQRNYRRDLEKTLLPEEGTPVSILYAGDNCYVML